jgi:manganese transport protein
MLQSEPRSLSEIHSSVPTAVPGFWKRLFAFAGPAYLVSVGYMDPGNWATDLEGGSRFGYQLIWVLVLSNAMAILLQTLSARLGIVSRRDLAQACRETYPRPVNLTLWVFCEIAIAATDLAEVLGAAIALNLLFNLPLMWAVLLTAADSLFILSLLRLGVRKFEAVILWLVTAIGGCFAIELFLAQPSIAGIASGLVPRINSESLYVAVGILGATVMPHNLYLHSSLVQTRTIGATEDDKRRACRFNLIDSAVALNAALLVNAAILILAAAVFHAKGIEVTEIQQAHIMLAPLLGTTAASFLFAFALLLSGQASTITGTLAGQIVMEGFLNIRMRPWLRRFLTRALAITPAVAVIAIAGESAVYQLLILSQVILSLQLPFAVLPLIRFTSDKSRMGVFANRLWVLVLAGVTAAIILALNFSLAYQTIESSLSNMPGWLLLLIALAATALAVLVAYLLLEPLLPYFRRHAKPEPVTLASIPAPEISAALSQPPTYNAILVPLDHSRSDASALRHAIALSRPSNARLLLLHVEEGVTSQIYGEESSTSEVTAGVRYLSSIAQSLKDQGISSEIFIFHATSPADKIIAFAKAQHPDLIVMAGHGHGALGDFVYGQTIERVRHALKIPIFVVQ